MVGREYIVYASKDGRLTFNELWYMACDSVYAPNGSGKGDAERVVYKSDQVRIIDIEEYEHA